MVEASDFWWKLLYWSSTPEFLFVRLTCVPSLDDLQPDAPFILSLYPVVVFSRWALWNISPVIESRKHKRPRRDGSVIQHIDSVLSLWLSSRLRPDCPQQLWTHRYKNNWWNVFTFTCVWLFFWKYGELSYNLAADQTLCPCGKSRGCRPAALIMGSITLSDLMILFKEGVGRWTREEEINPA